MGQYEKRELREFYKVWNERKSPRDMVCKYDGTTYSLIHGEKEKMDLKDYEMPFISRHRKTSSKDN